MSIAEWFGPGLLDLALRKVDDWRDPTVGQASGEVLEIGFGTGLNVAHYGPGVKSLVALDPKIPSRYAPVAARMAAARFPIERADLRADLTLPFDAGRFDCAVCTWTL